MPSSSESASSYFFPFVSGVGRPFLLSVHFRFFDNFHQDFNDCLGVTLDRWQAFQYLAQFFWCLYDRICRNDSRLCYVLVLEKHGLSNARAPCVTGLDLVASVVIPQRVQVVSWFAVGFPGFPFTWYHVHLDGTA